MGGGGEEDRRRWRRGYVVGRMIQEEGEEDEGEGKRTGEWGGGREQGIAICSNF